MKKLSRSQFHALHQLPNNTHEARSAYQIGASIATMNALQKKGLVTGYAGLGYFAFPRSGLSWKLTEAGLKLRKETRHQYAE